MEPDAQPPATKRRALTVCQLRGAVHPNLSSQVEVLASLYPLQVVSEDTNSRLASAGWWRLNSRAYGQGGARRDSDSSAAEGPG
jgi:hypothetical protein